MLHGDSSVYLATHFRSKQDALLKKREIDRQTVSRNIINFEDAEKVVGYLNMFQPDCDFMAGLAHAHAEAVLKAYELEGQPLTQKIIDTEIMPQVEKILAESSGGVIAREKGRMTSRRVRTRTTGGVTSAKLGSLTRHLTKHVNETRKAIRNEVTLHMLEMKKKVSPDQRRAAVQPAGEYAYHPEVERVSRQLFMEGNFRQAVLDAFIHVIATVKQRTGLKFEGDDLMNRSFCPDKTTPPVRFNSLQTSEEKDEQRGIWFLFKGLVQMRNYKAHLVTTFDDPHRAHEYLALASLLLRLLETATIQKAPQTL
jgi:uncharacterized protein (TIGR02391 family)